MTEMIIRAEALTRDFNSRRAVDQLSIDVPRGAIFGFLGPNGSGKTTTIRMLLGLLEPTSGNAEVLGFSILRQSEQIREQCGALLEHPGVYERLSAEDNLDLYGRIWKLSSHERSLRIKELLSTFGLWDRRKDAAGSWSRGMKQKLGVARAMLHRPSLVFLDEPTAGMDPLAAADLREELVGLVQREGVTVFLTTHNLSEAEKLCSRVAVIRDGKLLAIGHPDDLRSQRSGPRTEVIGRGFTEDIVETIRSRPEVRLATLAGDRLIIDLNSEARIASLLPALIDAGVQIEEIRKATVSLEDVFLTLVEERPS